MEILTTAIEHLPESENINNCQTSATFTKFIQHGFLSTNILRFCRNEHKKSKLIKCICSFTRPNNNNLRAIRYTLSSLSSFSFVCLLVKHFQLLSQVNNQPQRLNKSFNCKSAWESSRVFCLKYRLIDQLNI